MTVVLYAVNNGWLQSKNLMHLRRFLISFVLLAGERVTEY